MRLLVSVRDAVEAQAALAGGADIVDAKEPLNGALGQVEPATLRSISDAVAGAAPLSMALGDYDSDAIDGSMHSAATAGVTFVKIGFAGSRFRTLDHRGPGTDQAPGTKNQGPQRHVALIVVAYADYIKADAPSPDEVIEIGRRMNARGVLLDTYDKAGPGLTSLMTAPALRAFVARAQSHGQIAALAGKLTADDIELVCEAGADIAGFRGAACEGGRAGVVSAARVRALRARLDSVNSGAHSHHA